jgi:glycosyltransferase involved in cell wall biosynthesis
MDSLSVIICSYNPNPRVLEQCLQHLAVAIEAEQPFEVLLIDNNSNPSLESLEVVKSFQAKYLFTRVILETNQGLTPARLRGMRESKGSVLIFIDDDNFIKSDFLEKVKKVANDYPFIGSFSGQVKLVSEVTPDEWTKKYWGMLVHRQFEGNHWSNLYFNNDTMPCGAGLCVRREVAAHYLKLFDEGKRTLQLDRSKGSLMSGGDNDLAMCAIDVSMGMGIFEAIKVDHFIPASRFTLDYLSRLAYGIYYSYVVLKYLRTGKIEAQSTKRVFFNKLRNVGMNKFDKRINQFLNKGLADAALFLQNQTK